MTKTCVWAVAVVAVLGLGACGDDDGGGAAAPPPQEPPPEECTPPATATVAFSADVHPLLIANCGACHGTTFGSSTRETAYAAVQTRVDTTDPESSLLLQKGTNSVSHGGGLRLDPDEATTVTTWITECAQDN